MDAILLAVRAARAAVLALIFSAPISWADWSCWAIAGTALACLAMALSWAIWTTTGAAMASGGMACVAFSGAWENMIDSTSFAGWAIALSWVIWTTALLVRRWLEERWLVGWQLLVLLGLLQFLPMGYHQVLLGLLLPISIDLLLGLVLNSFVALLI
jgi:hypothetical protein